MHLPSVQQQERRSSTLEIIHPTVDSRGKQFHLSEVLREGRTAFIAVVLDHDYSRFYPHNPMSIALGVSGYLRQLFRPSFTQESSAVDESCAVALGRISQQVYPPLDQTHSAATNPPVRQHSRRVRRKHSCKFPMRNLENCNLRTRIDYEGSDYCTHHTLISRQVALFPTSRLYASSSRTKQQDNVYKISTSKWRQTNMTVCWPR